MGTTKSRRAIGSQHHEGQERQEDAEDADAGAASASKEQPRPGHAPSGVFRASGGERRVSGGWTIAEQFVREGYCYRLLRRPVTAADEEAPRLTKRELAVLELASAGHGNKSIAQLLEVSPSTIGVLLFRAAMKLNVASRSDLLLAYQTLKAADEPRPEPEPDGDPSPER